MTFAGINYLAVLAAAVVAYIAGAAWYMTLGGTWRAALGMTAEDMAKRRAEPGAFLPFVYVFVAELVMAWVFAGVLGHLGPGQVSVRNGIISGAFLWFGFVITSMLGNNSFAGRDWRLMLIDGGHWLLVMLLIGATLGAIGV